MDLNISQWQSEVRCFPVTAILERERLIFVLVVNSSNLCKILDYSTTVRSDAEERVAEERLAWKHKNVPVWTKNVIFLWDFGRLPSAMYVVNTW